MARTKAQVRHVLAKTEPTTTTLAIRKKHRKRPGTKALQEIRRLQKGTDNLIPKAALRRCVAEIAQDICKQFNLNGVRFEKSAMQAMHAAVEDYLTELMTKTVQYSVHAGRVTLMVKDLRLALENLKAIYKCESA
jgi:histone H3-like centromeric protein A